MNKGRTLVLLILFEKLNNSTRGKVFRSCRTQRGVTRSDSPLKFKPLGTPTVSKEYVRY